MEKAIFDSVKKNINLLHQMQLFIMSVTKEGLPLFETQEKQAGDLLDKIVDWEQELEDILSRKENV